MAKGKLCEVLDGNIISMAPSPTQDCSCFFTALFPPMAEWRHWQTLWLFCSLLKRGRCTTINIETVFSHKKRYQRFFLSKTGSKGKGAA
ncbi:hypothetical protein V2J23_07510 [Geobacillus thermoleovorans]|uniref:hypothetical protein n=1 Tax=Geobacillus thermoleovorans TaxID=33941 RepID=UPI00345BCB07